jgi:hypothetical protein
MAFQSIEQTIWAGIQKFKSSQLHAGSSQSSRQAFKLETLFERRLKMHWRTNVGIIFSLFTIVSPFLMNHTENNGHCIVVLQKIIFFFPHSALNMNAMQRMGINEMRSV